MARKQVADDGGKKPIEVSVAQYEHFARLMQTASDYFADTAKAMRENEVSFLLQHAKQLTQTWIPAVAKFAKESHGDVESTAYNIKFGIPLPKQKNSDRYARAKAKRVKK